MLSNATVSPTLPAADLERAKKFYTEKLGLAESPEQTPGGVTFQCGGGTQLYVYERPAVQVEHTQASFAVEDLAAVMADLREKGVEFEEYDMPGLKTEDGVATIDGHKVAWFKDSEGNILAIGQSGEK